MPEAPEVYNYHLFLKDNLLNKQITTIRILSGKLLRNIDLLNVLHTLSNKIIVDIRVHGKVIFIKLSGQSDCYLEFSHGMTGYWTDIYIKHSRIEIVYGSSMSIYFNDSRNFGNFYILTQEQYESRVSLLGPSILGIHENDCLNLFRKKSRSELCKVLMDQHVISGIGNYLRAEIMWYAYTFKEYFGLNYLTYKTKIGELSEVQLKTILYIATQITRYYAGLNYSLFITPKDFDRTTFVYSQKEDPFGNIVYKMTYHNRTLHYI